MNTPAHVIFSLALLGRGNAAKYAVAIAVGAVLPDLLMFVFYVYEKLKGVPETVIWSEHYFLPFWQGVFDTVNSLPLIGLGLVVAVYIKRPAWILLFASMIIHCLLDFPVHHDDGHRHFFPFSDFRFNSPISYWNPKYYGNIVGLIELILFIGGSIFLWCYENRFVTSVRSLTTLRMVILLTASVYLVFFGFVAITWTSM